MSNPKPSDFAELKQLMMKQTDGLEKPAAVRSLSFSMLWCLTQEIDERTLMDMLELLRFELRRKQAEGEFP